MPFVAGRQALIRLSNADREPGRAATPTRSQVGAHALQRLVRIYQDSLDAVNQQIQHDSAGALNAANTNASRTRMLLILLSVVAFGGVFLAARLVVQGIVSPLSRRSPALGWSHADLTGHVEVNGEDEVAVWPPPNDAVDDLSVSPRSASRPWPSSFEESCPRRSTQMAPRLKRPRPRPRRVRRGRAGVANVQYGAAGAEEMSASIREIARTPTSRPGRELGGRHRRERTTTVSKLGDSSAEIGEVIKVITVDRRADQPAGAERDDRGGARRRGGQGLRGRRQRGQGARQGDREGDRRHQPARSTRSRATPAARSRRSARSRASSARSTTSRRRSPAPSRSSRDDQRDRPQRHRGGHGRERDRREHHRRRTGGARHRDGRRLNPGARPATSATCDEPNRKLMRLSRGPTASAMSTGSGMAVAVGPHDESHHAAVQFVGEFREVAGRHLG